MGIINDIEEHLSEGEYDITADDDMTLEEFTEAGMAREKGFAVSDADPMQLKIGSKIEMEHTTNPKMAERIALDHLAEIPDYYTRLVAMEREAGRDMDEYVRAEDM